MENYKIEPLFIETAFVTDVASCGTLKEIQYFNKSVANVEEDSLLNTVIAYTQGEEIPFINNRIFNTTIVVINENLTVTQVLAKNSEDQKGDANLVFTVPKGCFAICSMGSVEEAGSNVTFLYENFSVGDIIRLRWKEEVISINKLNDIIMIYEGKPVVILDGMDIYATKDEVTTVSGTICNIESDKAYQIIYTQFDGMGNEILSVTESLEPTSQVCKFTKEFTINAGVSYVDVTLKIDESTLTETKSKVIYRRVKNNNNEKQVVMWIEQYVNAKALDTAKKIEEMIRLAKKEGVTSFALDVKGCGGFAAHKKTTLTNVPYMTETTNPKKHIEVEIDFLEEFIKAAHTEDMPVYASINFFVEGMLNPYDSAIDIANTHPDWAEIIQVPEDGGELKSILETKKISPIIYVNPANDEVQEFQLKRAEEVLINYDVDGLIMDRTRYDNQYADFSETTRIKFERFLHAKNKTLGKWPDDVYTFDKDCVMKTGSLYYEWLTFRSSVIAGFAARLRKLVDTYNKENNKNVALAAYVGSWYESYYQNGVNWAAKDFVYNKRLDFPLSDLYTEEYSQTSYVDMIDFLMIGCYYNSEEQIAKYVALGMLLTNDKIPLIGSISLPDLATKELQRTGFEACYNNSDGCMIFDLCYVDWSKLSYAMNGDKN